MCSMMAKEVTNGQVIRTYINHKTVPEVCKVIQMGIMHDGQISLFTKDLTGKISQISLLPDQLIEVY